MSVILDFQDKLLRILVPTKSQVFGSIILAIGILMFGLRQNLVARIGIPSATISATSAQLVANFDAVLRSGIAAQLALMTFWAIVGLVAYLVCWGAYNVFIEARNELTLTTDYTNRGHWRGPYETLALKTACGLALAALILSVRPGISLWLALSAPIIGQFSATNTIQLVVAIIGLAVQLYAILLFVQLTFTPWYRVQPFTQS
jgi:hypothetical protein